MSSDALSSPAETSRLLGVDESEIDVVMECLGGVSYDELLRSLLVDAAEVLDDRLATPSPPRGCMRRQCCCGSGRDARLPPDVESARVTVRKMAKVKMAEDGGARQALHQANLAAIFLELTGNEAAAAESTATFTGDHWMEIGFQGSDPSRDLRAAGMLAVLQLRYLTTVHRGFAQQLLELSNDQEQYFPFATVSINVTAICLQVLRSRACSRLLLEASEAYEQCGPETVLTIANRLYAGAMLALRTRWIADSCTITDFQMVSEDLTASCLENPRRFYDTQPPPGAEILPALPEGNAGP